MKYSRRITKRAELEMSNIRNESSAHLFLIRPPTIFGYRRNSTILSLKLDSGPQGMPRVGKLGRAIKLEIDFGCLAFSRMLLPKFELVI